MDKISTTVLTHMIIFKDSSRMEITAKQREAYMLMQKNPAVKGVDIRNEEGNLQYVSFDTVAKILSWDEFIDQYPDVTPEPVRRKMPDPDYTKPEDKFIFDETWSYLEALNKQYSEVCRVDRVMMYDKFRRAENFDKLLLDEKAVNTNGNIILDWKRSDKKGSYAIVLRYEVYKTMKRFKDSYAERRNYARKREAEALMAVQG